MPAHMLSLSRPLTHSLSSPSSAEQSVRCLSSLADGRIISGADDRTVRVWNLTTGESQKLSGHTKSVLSVAALGKTRVISGSYDKSVCVWDLTTGLCAKELLEHAEEVRAVAVIDGDRLLSGSMDRTVCVWTAASKSDPRTVVGHSEVGILLRLLTPILVMISHGVHSAFSVSWSWTTVAW